jgi:hypothetical protein
VGPRDGQDVFWRREINEIRDKNMTLMAIINYGNTNDNIRGVNNGDTVDNERHS